MQIDRLAARDALSAMLRSHIRALEAAQDALDDIARAASCVAQALEAGATVYYAAAGSSGLMALSDASELAGTFQIPHRQIRICMAGGVPVDGHMPGHTEDHTQEAEHAARDIVQGDVALVLSASGTTPYALAFAKAARARGATLIGIAKAADAALLRMSDISIALNTAPEVVEGSTRLGAGTAQKAVLNMISTQAGILMGHVYEGLMVNLKPDNAKLRQRAAQIVARIADVTVDEAENTLRVTGYDTKLAVLVAAGAEHTNAQDLLKRHRGQLGACLQDAEIKTKMKT